MNTSEVSQQRYQKRRRLLKQKEESSAQHHNIILARLDFLLRTNNKQQYTVTNPVNAIVIFFCWQQQTLFIHFASAFVAVIFSQLIASSSASWRLNKPPSSL